MALDKADDECLQGRQLKLGKCSRYTLSLLAHQYLSWHCNFEPDEGICCGWPQHVSISAGNGMTLTVVVFITANISGAHLNPAVSLLKLDWL